MPTNSPKILFTLAFSVLTNKQTWLPKYVTSATVVQVHLDRGVLFVNNRVTRARFLQIDDTIFKLRQKHKEHGKPSDTFTRNTSYKFPVFFFVFFFSRKIQATQRFCLLPRGADEMVWVDSAYIEIKLKQIVAVF